MAKDQGVWGIDIGQCGLKALRCLPGEGEGTITADAFDYIEYPKILSQPEAEPDALIAEALQQFLSRNEVRGDKVAISVAGQNGLSRFIKLPPVETKKIPDIVGYEARQQIPFDLDDVIWDYQEMAGGMIEEGFALDTEVGLFAMKRDQVYRALQPFDAAGIEVDIVQLTPLALFNYVAHDVLTDLPEPEMYDPENPPDSTLILSLGTDTTDLVITNGFRVWQRSVPIGGNHFTKALSKDLKQTFAKAEHLKRNAAKAENPKALFQAMRPIFAELVTEVQRSINFFSNVHKKANISGGIALGSTGKLPGLVRFLSQNLKMPITRAESFKNLQGAGIVDAPAFKENVLALPVCYGLCLQGLVDTAIRTNLIPVELLTERLIRAKKPWAVAAAASLLLGLTISFAGHWNAWTTVRDERFKTEERATESRVSQWNTEKTNFSQKLAGFQETDVVGQHLVHDLEARIRWLNMYKAINLSLPFDKPGEEPKEVARQNRLFVTEITTNKRDLAAWYGFVTAGDQPKKKDGDNGGGIPNDFGVNPGVGAGPNNDFANPAPPDGQDAGPQGSGWVVTVKGHHFHNIRDDALNQGAKYVERTLVEDLKREKVIVSQDGKETEILIKAGGIQYPVVTSRELPNWNYKAPNPDYDPEDPEAAPPMIDKPRYDFVVQFCWIDPAEQSKQNAPGGDPFGNPNQFGNNANPNPF